VWDDKPFTSKDKVQRMLHELFPGKALGVGEDSFEYDNVAGPPFPGKSSGQQSGELVLVRTALEA
jgi:hypothetical protein